MGLLTSLFGPAPDTALLGYNADAERAAKFSGRLTAMGQALLQPARHMGDIGQIGRAVAAGNVASQKAGSSYLQEAMSRQLNAQKQEADKAAKADKAKSDAAKADFIAANPQYRQFIEMYPEEFGEFWKKHMLGEEGLAPGQKGKDGKADLSLQVTKVFNNETQKWEDWQTGEDGIPHRVDYGEGREAAGPGEASVRGSEFKAFEKQQDAAYTSVTNAAQASTDIANLREVVTSNPDLVTGWVGTALKDLPDNVAADVKARLAQIEAGAFFSSIQEMQGYGALSNSEGQRVAQAKSRVNQALSYDAFLTALDDYEKVIQDVYERNQKFISTGDWKEMDKIRKENAGSLKFKKSRTPPYPGEGIMSVEDWGLLDADAKRQVYENEGLKY